MAKKEKEITNKTESEKKPKAKVIKEEENTIIVLSKEEKAVPYNETIETQRKGLFSLYKKTSRMSTIIMFVVVVVFIAAFVMMGQPYWGQPVCWTIVGVTLVGLIVYFIFTKNLYPNASKNYFKVFWQEINDYIFNAPEFTDCKIDTKERYVLPDVITDRVYTNVVDSASRNIVRGKYKGKGFALGELAFYKQGAKPKQKDVMFVGRHLAVENNLHFEDRYIVNIRTKEPVDLPNDIEDLKELVSNNNFVIYGKEGANVEKDLGKTLINNLKSIECTGCLLNVNIVFWAGHTSVYFSFDDTIAAIPFEKAIETSSYEQLRKVVLHTLSILESK